MRMWHKDLLCCLPKQQLQGQWKELYAIVGEMEKRGKLTRERGYLLVSPLNDVCIGDLVIYIKTVHELGISTDQRCIKLLQRVTKIKWEGKAPLEMWHGMDYLRQCFYNLQEKYQCGGMTQSEYNRIVSRYVMLGGKM